MMQKIHDTFGDLFNGNGCFKGTFSLQLKSDSKPYQAPSRCVVYVLQKPFKEELEYLQKMDIITPLGVDEMAEWYTGGSRLSRIFWEHENLSGLSVIRLIQLLLLKTNIRIKHCSTSKGSYWEDVLVWK